MEFKEFSAKTADEAIIKASIELGVSSENLEIQVVTEGSSGFFGIGKNRNHKSSQKRRNLTGRTCSRRNKRVCSGKKRSEKN